MVAWGDELILYHHHSGDTHLLSARFLPLVQYCLQQAVFSSDDLMNQCKSIGETLQKKQHLINLFLQQFIQLNILQQLTDCEST